MANVPIRDDIGIPAFPGNSKGEKAQEVEVVEKKVEKIVTGKVAVKKKTLGQKFADTFIATDGKTVMDYILHDVMAPAFVSLVEDTVQGVLGMVFRGENRPHDRTRRQGGASYVNYGGYSSYNDRRPKSRFEPGNRAKHEFDNLGFATRGEAENVLGHLVDLTIDYGFASVADLYEFAGVESSYTDQKWGWHNLEDARVVRGRYDYEIKLPRTEALD